jgi:hypothetical protein
LCLEAVSDSDPELEAEDESEDESEEESEDDEDEALTDGDLVSGVLNISKQISYD